jgi:GDP/UDP-N,N'-diacetylbacillosamine 2-epimerase (hydrolysing)
MGEDPKNVFVTGSLALDNMKKMKYFSKKYIENNLNFKFGKKNIIFTLHPETLGNNILQKKIKPILKNLKKLKDTKIIFTIPNVDMGNKYIYKAIKDFTKKNKVNSILVKSMGQELYFSVLKFVDLVIGNSSSGIIEVPSFNIPTINIGNRQRGRLKSKSVIDYDFTKDNFEQKLKKGLSKSFIKKIYKNKNPYYKKNSTKLMISLMKKINFSNGTQKEFYEKKN